jgi:hypothetical protein
MLALNALILLVTVGYAFVSGDNYLLSNVIGGFSILLIFNFIGGLLLLVLTIWFEELRYYCYSLLLLFLVCLVLWVICLQLYPYPIE